MLSLTVSQNSGQPLAEQIVAGIKRQIDDRQLRPGNKLPSIRILPRPTASAASRWSRHTIGWWHWAICNLAAAPAFTPGRAVTPHTAPSDTTNATSNWSG